MRRCHELFTADTRNTFPGFPTQPYASFAASMRRPRNAHLGLRHSFAAYEDGAVIGFATVAYPDSHLLEWAYPRVFVDEARLRRGVGSALLREIVADVRAEGRAKLAHEQVRFGTAGEHWARAVGLVNTQRNHWQMLYVTELDPAIWEAPVPAGFRLAQWSDAAPEELVVEFARARNAIGDRPTGESSLEDSEWTVERVRQHEADIRETGDDLRFVVAIHEESGDVAAVTGMRVDPGRVDICWQRDTAVVREFRGLGLGRAIKAAMMRWLLEDIPALERVVTNTASDNAYMIRVNEQLGYTHYADIGVFEATVEQVGAALGMSAAIPAPRRESASEDEPVA